MDLLRHSSCGMESDIPSFDHYTLAVTDLKASLNFYCGILGLSLLPRPDFDFEGAWVSIGKGLALHLITGADIQPPEGGSRALHFAFGVSEIHLFRSHLLACGVAIPKDIKPRPDGALQMFVRDPDGYWIEIVSRPTNKSNIDKLS